MFWMLSFCATFIAGPSAEYAIIKKCCLLCVLRKVSWKTQTPPFQGFSNSTVLEAVVVHWRCNVGSSASIKKDDYKRLGTDRGCVTRMKGEQSCPVGAPSVAPLSLFIRAASLRLHDKMQRNSKKKKRSRARAICHHIVMPCWRLQQLGNTTEMLMSFRGESGLFQPASRQQVIVLGVYHRKRGGRL